MPAAARPIRGYGGRGRRRSGGWHPPAMLFSALRACRRGRLAPPGLTWALQSLRRLERALKPLPGPPLTPEEDFDRLEGSVAGVVLHAFSVLLGDVGWNSQPFEEAEDEPVALPSGSGQVFAFVG